MYTYRIEESDNGIVVWIDKDGDPIIMQPHDPQADLTVNPTWPNFSSAEEWAKQWVYTYQDKV